MIIRTLKSLFALCAINNHFSVLDELKIKINSLGLKVKCNLSGMLGGIKGNGGIYISEPNPKETEAKSKEGRHWEVGCHPKLEPSPLPDCLFS